MFNRALSNYLLKRKYTNLRFTNPNPAFYNLSYDKIEEHYQKNKEGYVIHTKYGEVRGIDTGKFTGRSPKDKYIVKQYPSSQNIWWGEINKPMNPSVFEELFDKCSNHYSKSKKIYVFDGFCGASKNSRKKVRFLTEYVWQHHFVKNMFIKTNEKFDTPDFTIMNTCNIVNKDWEKHQLNSEVFIAFNIEKKLGLIGGTHYGGCMKKGMFTMMNYWLPLNGIMSMHCSANIGSRGDTALFFGLSGTGKCHGINTPILMFDGKIKMVQDIIIGDLIMGDDSKPRKVLNLGRGIDEMYKITNHEGESYIVNSEHILCVKHNLTPYVKDIEDENLYILQWFNTDTLKIDTITQSYKNISKEKAYQILEKELEKKKRIGNYFTITVKRYLQMNSEYHKNILGYKVAIDFPEKKLSLDPYLFGLWLGDETSTCHSSVNQELKNKHIPYIYKCNSRQNRLKLLAGLIDSDGHYEYNNKRLVEDIEYLVRSLGCACCFNKEMHYRLCISGNNLEELSVLCKRKKSANFFSNKDVLFSQIHVNHIGKDNYYGFELDGNHKYVMGNFIVTHNTALSADPERRLIGDDEHGWDNNGIFNFEGGCYAKTLNLSEENEPDIYRAIHPNALLENISYNKKDEPEYDNDTKTQNGRVSYPLYHISNYEKSSLGGHPENIIFLTCDAFGVLPPVSRLTEEQAMYHFLLGYTAKVAGTERGVDKPQATFSSCFGAAFLPLHPKVYAKLLAEKVRKHDCKVWLVNTGWSGGDYGKGKRMNIKLTRACIDAILNDKIKKFEKEKYFDLEIPYFIPGVDNKVLNPINTWVDPEKYEIAARNLSKMFDENYNKIVKS